MSSWPLISDFAKMLQNPQVAFRAPEFKTCSVEANQLGQPKARSGNFATVYRGYRPDGSEFAIRIFNRRQDERLEHYRTISEYLEQRALTSIVRFEYDERGIRSASDGKMYPLLTMEWVPGITLFEWCRDRCREGYAQALQIASDVWLHVVRELAANSIVHGDLQHGNVMVSPEGHFKLVDYDCMCVPSLIGRRNLEIGMVPYQHPARDMDTVLFPGMDNFSSLVIYVALRALAAAPYLWQTYVDQPGYDRILFRREDFQNPRTSTLYRELLRSPDEQVRDLAHYLFELVKYNLHDIPPVDEVLRWCQSITSLIGAREWDHVVQLVDRMGPNERLAPELQPYIQEARNRVACRQATEEALAQGDEDRVEQLYATGLLHDYPGAAHLLEPASRAAEVRPLVRALAFAYQFQSWDQLKATWLANQHVLAGRTSTRVYEEEVQKLLTVDRIHDLMAAREIDERALQEAWDYLQKLGGHATAEPYRATIEQRLRQRVGMAKLQELFLQAPKIPTLEYDKKVAATVPPQILQGLDEASPLYKHIQAVNKRLKCVKRVRELDKQVTVESETFIANVMQQLPNQYHEGVTRRSQQARKRMYAYREFIRALQEPCSETAAVKAWKELEQLRALTMVSKEHRERVKLAEVRVPLIKALQAIPANADPAEKQSRVLEVWDDKLLQDCDEAEPWRQFYAGLQTAKATVQQLEQALTAGNVVEAKRLLAAPALQVPALPRDLAQAVEAARDQIQHAALAKRQALINALRDNRRSEFAELFDAEAVAEVCRQSRHHQPLISQWLESEILPLSRIGLTADPERAFRWDGASPAALTWTWPAPHISQACRVAICKQRPRPQVQPDDVPALYTATVTRDQWNPEAGYQVPLDAAWEGSFVVVWAAVDLGFQTFYSEPLELGQIRVPGKEEQAQPRWGLFRGRKKAKVADEEAAVGQPAAAADAGAVDPARQLQQRWAAQCKVAVEETNAIGMKLVLIPPGEFQMGSPDTDAQADAEERPQHRVTLTKPYWLGQCPVTEFQYQKVMGINPSAFKDPTETAPVDMVSWDDAQEFCKRLSALTQEKAAGRKYRLPTEAEWEYACRAGTTTRFCFGEAEDMLHEHGWFDANSGKKKHPVAQKKPNAWGLYDMHGNVFEWCQDGHDDQFYANSPAADPKGPTHALCRVVRGGSWSNSAHDCRSAYRLGSLPGLRDFIMGFRVVAVIPDKPS
jgi:formylglycine-generating enzyme required for sulfatase activity